MVTNPETRIGIRPGVSTGGLRAVVLGCAVAVCLAGWNAALDSAAAQDGTACPLTPSLDDASSALPPDVCNSGGIADENFYALSWQMFKFLAWPGASGQRGNPDTTRSITSMEGPRTFETLKADWEIFLPGAATPSAWIDYSGAVGPCRNRPNIPPGALVLASFSEFGNLSEGEPRISHVLVAQNRTYVRYQTVYNESAFRKIEKGRLYDEQNVKAIENIAAGTPVPEIARHDDGALTVKAAWIELPADGGTSATRIDPSRFYVRHDAWVQNPQTLHCHSATVGLVGLHIVYKTKSRPQWIWSTFEHVDNVPSPDDSSPRSYTFHNGDHGVLMTSKPDDEFRLPRADGTMGPAEPARAYQVQRLQKIDPRVLAANQAWQEKFRSLGSVWQHYMLVMTQWPFIPSAPELDAGSGPDNTTASPTPRCARRGGPATANTTLETFMQGPEDGRCVAASTCMGCHNSARKTDFIWSIKLNRNTLPAQPGPSSRSTAIKALEEVLQSKE